MTDLNLAIDKANSALLVIHMQRDIVGADGKGGSDGIVDADEQGIASMRSALAAGAGEKDKRREKCALRTENKAISSLGRPCLALVAASGGPHRAPDCRKEPRWLL